MAASVCCLFLATPVEAQRIEGGLVGPDAATRYELLNGPAGYPAVAQLVRSDVDPGRGDSALRAFHGAAGVASLIVHQDDGSTHWLGAIIGGVIGSVGTYAVLNAGDSTAPCDESANQDAIGTGYCVGSYVLGAVAGAGVGWLVDRWISGD